MGNTNSLNYSHLLNTDKFHHAIFKKKITLLSPPNSSEKSVNIGKAAKLMGNRSSPQFSVLLESSIFVRFLHPFSRKFPATFLSLNNCSVLVILLNNEKMARSSCNWNNHRSPFPQDTRILVNSRSALGRLPSLSYRILKRHIFTGQDGIKLIFFIASSRVFFI